MALADDHDEQKLKALVQMMFQAVDQADAALLNRYIADDYSLNEPHSYGKFVNKSQIINRWSNKEVGDEKLVADPTLYDIHRVHISGDTAIVFILVTDKWQDGEGDHVLQTWVSDTWVRRDGEWRWLASHETHLRPA